MKNLKSDRLRKLDAELSDLKQWMQLGLVPKKDIKKYKDEIIALEHKIKSEKERIQFLQEHGEAAEYITTKKNFSKSDSPAITNVDMENIEVSIDIDQENFEKSTSYAATEPTIIDEEDPFSDKNRWRRGILDDPDVDNW